MVIHGIFTLADYLPKALKAFFIFVTVLVALGGAVGGTA
jgi:hypothetical protein